jgi:large subunit ribosomal protein L20
MPRAKRGTKLRRRHNKLRNRAEGMVLGLGSQIRRTAEALDRAGVYAYRDRRVKKRDFRGLWIARLSAATAGNDISYSRFIHALSKAKIGLNRKMLSEIAIHDQNAFATIVNKVRSLAPTI